MPVSHPSPADNTKLAVTVIVFTVLALSFGDALIKKVSADLVIWQIFVLRSVLAVPVLVAILRVRFPGVRFRPAALGWTGARSLMLVLMWIVYYAALPHVPLSIAASAYYTLPIFITLFSALLGGEKVSLPGWAAVGLGFGGVVLILRPAAADFNLYALLPLVSAMLYALAMILTRTKCRDEHPLVLAGALNVAFILVGLLAPMMIDLSALSDVVPAFLSGTWGGLGGNEVLAVGLLAIAVLVGSVGTAIAYQTGASSVVATFDFAYVGFAVVWGLLFFSEVPNALALAGMVMIVAAGMVAVTR